VASNRNTLQRSLDAILYRGRSFFGAPAVGISTSGKGCATRASGSCAGTRGVSRLFGAPVL